VSASAGVNNINAQTQCCAFAACSIHGKNKLKSNGE